MRYERYLQYRGVVNGVINYIRTFRALFNKCRDYYNDEDKGRVLINHYPFKIFNFPHKEDKTKLLDDMISAKLILESKPVVKLHYQGIRIIETPDLIKGFFEVLGN